MRQPKNECTCENCICKNADVDLNYLHEEILWLAEDVMVLDEEKDDFIDWANTCVDNYNAALDDIDTNFSTLSEKIENVDGAWMHLFRLLFIWNIFLTVFIALSHYNVL